MKLKTIDSIINKKIDHWISSIDDESVRQGLKENVIVTGGCITSMLLNEDVNDFDIYFKDSNIAKRVAEYYTKDEMGDYDMIIEGPNDDYFVEKGRVKIFLKSRGILNKKKKDVMKYEPVYFSSNAITLSDKIQLIMRFTGSPEEIHSNYDFIHVTNYWTSKTGLVVNKEALVSILTKELVYRGSRYPICSVIRTRKFIKRGWTINAGQYLKMAFQINDLNLNDPRVLEDQLVGVDSAYFEALIEKLNDKNYQDLSGDKICEIIDEIFNEVLE